MAVRLVALIRGINVGTAKRVAMADLRQMFTDLGYSEVRTLLNSGNVVFSSLDEAADHAGRIESAMASRLGVSARVVVLTAAQLAAVAAENPLGDVDDYSRLLVAIPAQAADLWRLKSLAGEDWTPEILAVGPRAAYLWCPDGVIAGRLFAAVGKALGEQGTTRNWATLLKLQTLAENMGVN